jgi:ABC-type sulfate transport system substrate-binding protein
MAPTRLDAQGTHPNAALLFLDWLHSKEGQQIISKCGLWSLREKQRKKNYAEWDKINAVTVCQTKFSSVELSSQARYFFSPLR